MSNSIVKDWVSKLGLRHQGVLLTCVRGCDTNVKFDRIKELCRAFRERILKCHCGDPNKAKSFIERMTDSNLKLIMDSIISNHDHYPHHYLMHLIHAAEIIGYKDREDHQYAFWYHFYIKMCHKMHMTPETEEQLDNRLNADEASFAENQ